MTMNKFFLLSLSALLLVVATARADVAPEWRNPQVNHQNREARRANFFAFEVLPISSKMFFMTSKIEMY